MWINHFNKTYSDKHNADWIAIGIKPEPFLDAEFYAPADINTNDAPGIDGCNATAYSWSFSDVITNDLFLYLFADDNFSPNMEALIYDIIANLTTGDNNEMQLNNDAPQSWHDLLEWLRGQASAKEAEREIQMHQTGTWRAVYRRLWNILADGSGIFPRRRTQGNPLVVVRSQTSPPLLLYSSIRIFTSSRY